MLRKSMPMLAGILLAALVGASGCTSLNSMSKPSIFRGQDPAGMPPVEPMAPVAPEPMVDAAEAPAAAAPMPEAGTLAHELANPAADDGYQEAYADGGYCPPGRGMYPAIVCPRGGGYCRPGCGCGNQFDWYPRHHLSHSYTTPRNLSYPTQGAPSGAVVYPYYTLKGPGDFFRQ